MAICNIKGRVLASGWWLSASAQLIVHASLADRVIEFLTPYARFARCQLTRDPGPVHVREAPDGALLGRWAFTGPGTPPHADWTRDIEDALVEARFAWVSLATSESHLPQSLGLIEHNVVDFAKGCYLGQEIVARAQHRGEVKRTLVRLEGPHGAVQPGDRIETQSSNKSAFVISVASSGAILAVA